MMKGRRSNIEIIADILRMGQASKTQIMYRAGMSFSQLQKYLKYLTDRGFLVHDTELYPAGIYYVSAEGKLLLESIEKIEEVLTFDTTNELFSNVSDSMVPPARHNENALPMRAAMAGLSRPK
jgi:predicted transcriptional regulator